MGVEIDSFATVKPDSHNQVKKSLKDTKNQAKSLKFLRLSDNPKHEKLFINAPLERW